MTWIFLFAVAVISVQSCITIFSKAETRTKWATSLVGALALAVIPISVWEMQSTPKNVEDELFRSPKKVTLLASVSEEPLYFHIWVQFPEESRPRYYSIPWHDQGKKAARKVAELEAESEKRISIENLFAEGVRKFEAPQFNAPEKDPPPKVRDLDE